jgi:hypothetical protein
MSDDLEQSIAQLAKTVSDKFPVITLVSGERLLVREVQLYDEQTVAEIESLPKFSAFVSMDRVQNLQKPDPQSWFATKKDGRTRYVHNGEDFVNVRIPDGVISFRWSQVASYVPPTEAQTPAALPPPPQAA